MPNNFNISKRLLCDLSMLLYFTQSYIISFNCKGNFKCTRSFDAHHDENISSVSENDSPEGMGRTSQAL